MPSRGIDVLFPASLKDYPSFKEYQSFNENTINTIKKYPEYKNILYDITKS